MTNALTLQTATIVLDTVGVSVPTLPFLVVDMRLPTIVLRVERNPSFVVTF